MGKIIVIEGTDSSGKETQTKILYERLKKEGYNIKSISFPNYKSDSSLFVRKYLNGEYGKDVDEIDPYIISTFYALDRYETFNKGIQEFYDKGGIVIADRYTTSNMVHQASKIYSESEKDKYLEWVMEYEYGIFKLPIPNKVIFLDLPTEISNRLISKRVNKIDGSKVKDIHERSKEYLERSYNNAKYIANKYKWETVECSYKGEILGEHIIADKIYNEVKKIL